MQALSALAAAAAGGVLAVTGHVEPATAARKPNIVVVMTDDQTVASLRHMPITRRLMVDRGVRFSNAICSWPLCAPSRASFLTGMHAPNHGVAGNVWPAGGHSAFDLEDDSLPVWLRDAGYFTSHVGKWINGYGDDTPANVPPGWDDWYGTVGNAAYNYWGYQVNENGKRTTIGVPDHEDPALYQTDVTVDRAVRTIRARAGSSRPFFLNLWLLAPHFDGSLGDDDPPRPAPQDRGAFADEPLERDPSFDEDTSDKPLFMQAIYRDMDDRATAAVEARYRGQLQTLQAVDRGMLAILRTLRETKQLDNTYVVFTSDNGWFNGEHRIPKEKYWLYDASARVPLVLRGPRLPRGRVSRELVSNVDLTATLLEIAGAKPGRTQDGRSLLPFARHPSKVTDRPVLHQAQQNTLATLGGLTEGKVPSLPPAVTPEWLLRGVFSVISLQRIAPGFEGIRSRRWFFAEYTTGDKELYDLVRDPHQLTNVAGRREYAATRAALEAALGKRRNCHGSACNAALGPIPGPGKP